MKNNIIAIICILTIGFIACQSKNSTSAPAVQTEKVDERPLRIDYIKQHADDTTYSVSGNFKAADSISEYYTMLEKAASKHLVKEYEHGESRHAIPQSLSDQYLDYDKEIFIYNKTCQPVGKGSYVRHEIYNIAGGSEIVAIYNINLDIKDKSDQNEPYFMANKSTSEPKQGTYAQKPKLDSNQKKLLTQNEFVGRADNHTIQYKVNNDVITFHSNGNMTVFMGQGADTNQVFYSEDTMFDDVFATHFVHQGKPIFLIQGGQPDTDYYYSFAMQWDGDKYVVVK